MKVISTFPSRVCARRGYWKEIENVDAELRAFMEAHRLGGRLPTSRQLRAAGANALDVAVFNHGGYHAACERLGCVAQG